MGGAFPSAVFVHFPVPLLPPYVCDLLHAAGVCVCVCVYASLDKDTVFVYDAAGMQK